MVGPIQVKSVTSRPRILPHPRSGPAFATASCFARVSCSTPAEEHDVPGSRTRAFATGGISLPIWVPKILAGIREAEADRRRSDAEVRSTENRVLDEVKSAQARLAGAAEGYAILADEALPKARQNVKASEIAYTSGEIDFLALVDAQRMLLMKELETERARAEWVMRRAELDRAIGGTDR